MAFDLILKLDSFALKLVQPGVDVVAIFRAALIVDNLLERGQPALNNASSSKKLFLRAPLDRSSHIIHAPLDAVVEYLTIRIGRPGDDEALDCPSASQGANGGSAVAREDDDHLVRLQD